MREAEAHLTRHCPAMREHVPHHERYPAAFRRFKDPYQVLVRAVVYQQLSGEAAAGALRKRW